MLGSAALRSVEMQLVLRAGFPGHETIREGRLGAFAPAGFIEVRKLVLHDETSPGVHFVPPTPRRDRGGVGRARRHFAAIRRDPICRFGIFRADANQVVGGGRRRC